MRSSKLLILGAVLPALVLGGAALAEDDAAEAAAGVEQALDEAPAADPSASTPDGEPAASEAPAAAGAPPETAGVEPADVEPAAPADDALDTAALESAEASGPASADAESAALRSDAALGAVGYDSQGRAGRIHVVVPGDTLWDVSEAYLGTPWVWPSIWKDNREIENPHLVYPGDRIWITPWEMRRVSADEAAQLLSGTPASPGEPPAAAPEEPAPPPAIEKAPEERFVQLVSDNENTGLVSAEMFEASASIVDKVPERTLLSQEDGVYIGLGEGDVEVGDQLTIFRAKEKVYDPDDGRMLGYHVDLLGWLEVKQTFGETSLAEIRVSDSEIEIGDRLIPREPPVVRIPIQGSPGDVEGKISFFPESRVMMGTIDYVYLNRGTLDGLEVGSPLEVYREGSLVPEEARDTRVHVPDRVIAQLLVVRAREESSVAFVQHTESELLLGDRFRGAR